MISAGLLSTPKASSPAFKITSRHGGLPYHIEYKEGDTFKIAYSVTGGHAAAPDSWIFQDRKTGETILSKNLHVRKTDQGDPVQGN